MGASFVSITRLKVLGRLSVLTNFSLQEKVFSVIRLRRVAYIAFHLVLEAFGISLKFTSSFPSRIELKASG